MGVHTIAGVLSREKIDRPSYYLGSRGIGRHKNDYDHDNRYAWESATISIVLKRLEYCGFLVNLRTSSASYKSKKKKNNPKEDWLIFENHHEAIISQELFDTVQKLRETPRRFDSCGEANPLTGLLWCSDCEQKLYNHRKSKTEKPTHKKLTDVYCCSTYKQTNRRFNTQCSPHHISSEAARGIILEAIKATAGYVRDYEDEFIKRVRESSTIKKSESVKAYSKQIIKNERRLLEIDRIYKSLYEDKALGKIDEDVFTDMSEDYLQERVALRDKNIELQTELDELNDDNMKGERFIKIVKRFTNFEELTTPMLNSFVEKVIVHEGIWSEGYTGEGGRPRGSRSQFVEVFLKYIGSFPVPDLRTPEQIEADRLAEEKLEVKRAYHREKTRQWKIRNDAKITDEDITN
jgi:hypothetical protein